MVAISKCPGLSGTFWPRWRRIYRAMRLRYITRQQLIRGYFSASRNRVRVGHHQLRTPLPSLRLSPSLFGAFLSAETFGKSERRAHAFPSRPDTAAITALIILQPEPISFYSVRRRQKADRVCRGGLYFFHPLYLYVTNHIKRITGPIKLPNSTAR
jgi:hypothetical protein